MMRSAGLVAALTLVPVACASAPQEPAPARPPIPAPVSAPVIIAPDSIEPISTDRVDTTVTVLETTEGEATYYADMFDGRRTASGLVFRNAEAWAAHRTYPFGTVVRVTNLANDKSVIVCVVDRGPHGTSERARRTIIDVSQSAARDLDFIRAGRVPVRVEVLEWGTPGRRSLQSDRRDC